MSNQFLKKAKTNILKLNKDYLMFERVNDDKKMLVMVNATDDDVLVDIPEEYGDAEVVYTLKKTNRNILAGRGAMIMKK